MAAFKAITTFWMPTHTKKTVTKEDLAAVLTAINASLTNKFNETQRDLSFIEDFEKALHELFDAETLGLENTDTLFNHKELGSMFYDEALPARKAGAIMTADMQKLIKATKCLIKALRDHPLSPAQETDISPQQQPALPAPE